MTTVITPPDVRSAIPAPSQNRLLESFRDELVPQEKQAGASLLGSILRGTIWFTFAAAALTLISFALNPVVFVTLVLFAFALSPVIFLGLAIVFAPDLQRAEKPDTDGQPCSCHQDRLANTFAKR